MDDSNTSLNVENLEVHIQSHNTQDHINVTVVLRKYPPGMDRSIASDRIARLLLDAFLKTATLHYNSNITIESGQTPELFVDAIKGFMSRRQPSPEVSIDSICQRLADTVCLRWGYISAQTVSVVGSGAGGAQVSVADIKYNEVSHYGINTGPPNVQLLVDMDVHMAYSRLKYDEALYEVRAYTVF